MSIIVREPRTSDKGCTLWKWCKRYLFYHFVWL